MHKCATFAALFAVLACINCEMTLQDAKFQLAELLLEKLDSKAEVQIDSESELSQLTDDDRIIEAEETDKNEREEVDNEYQVNDLLEQFNKLLYQKSAEESAAEHLEADAETQVCINYIKLSAKTGNRNYADQKRVPYPRLVITVDGKEHYATLTGFKYKGLKYRMNFVLSDFHPRISQCLTKDKITGVTLKAMGNDGWFVESVTTEISNQPYGTYTKLTVDNPLNKWVDGDESYPYNAKEVPLTLYSTSHTPHCGYGVPVCECKETAKQCIFNLEIDEIMTFTSYQKHGIGLNEGLAVRGTQGVIYNIEESDGSEGAHPFYAQRLCADRVTNADKCTVPQYVDGKTYRMAVGVNGQIPGPTIIVHDGQEVVIHVHNNMSTEGISIHWHGMHQRNTPWMDGVGQVTQCQIGPSSSYSYNYIASPSGSFWYHSHSGAQRTDGFFGALIVKEREDKLKIIKRELPINTRDFVDKPEEHTISLLDWQHEASLDAFSQLNAGLGFYLDTPLGEVPNDCDVRYESTRSIERAEVGPVPYFSGLINGKGRHNDVPYSKTRLSEFRVVHGKNYRFRLIGAQGLYAYKFSIDGHRMTVVGTDGYWIEPVNNVDYIIIHTGERYDFILHADQPKKNYWLRAETLEIIPKGGPPYQSRGHVAEGILRYVDDNQANIEDIKSTDYEEIKLGSPAIQCTSSHKCNAVNCPFKNFHPAYHTECINVDKLQLLLDTDPNEMPAAVPTPGCKDCLHFINFNFEGDSETSSVNGRNFILPPSPPQTQYEDYEKQAIECDLTADCNPTTLACMCTHVRTVPYDKTIQFVLSAMGAYDNAHPIHLHGHTFHVVKVGYPDYDSKTGFIAQKNIPGCKGTKSIHNDDIACGDTSLCGSKCPVNGCNPNRCTKPGWSSKGPPSMTIDRKTIRKDTVMLPAGGYVVINFKSDNPGQWFLHCHIEVHQLEGMALIVNEAPDEQKNLILPKNLNKCGDFGISMEEYKKLLSNSRTKITAKASNWHG